MNMNSPFVSIIIACYNHELYINECLQSIISEGYQNFEIVIIDDGSTDASTKLIEEWIANNPSVNIQFYTQKNIGLTKTLNKLILKAKGEYLCMLGSDDKLVRGGIQKRINALIENPHKMAIIGDAFVINDKSEIIHNSAIEDLWLGKKSCYLTDADLKQSIINNWSIPGPVLLVNKKIFEIIGMYPENYLAEDLNFYLKVIGLNLLFFIDFNVAEYRVHDLNTCRNPVMKKKLLRSIILSYINNLKYYSLKQKLQMLKITTYNIKQYISIKN